MVLNLFYNLFWISCFMKFNRNLFLNLIGVFLVVLGVVRIFQLVFFIEPVHVFWLCNHAIIFIGIAILFRSSFWLIAEFIFLFWGQILWLVPFLLYFIFGIVVPGSSAHLIYDSRLINIISVMVHFLALPLGFVAILLLGKKEKFAWRGAIVHSLILLPIVLYFGVYYNLNCLLSPCFDFIPKFNLYPLALYAFYFLVFVLPLNYLINYIISKKR